MNLMTGLYGGLHQKFWTPISRPIGQLMGQNPKELPKAHLHAHAKAMILWKTVTVKRKHSCQSPKLRATFR